MPATSATTEPQSATEECPRHTLWTQPTPHKSCYCDDCPRLHTHNSSTLSCPGTVRVPRFNAGNTTRSVVRARAHTQGRTVLWPRRPSHYKHTRGRVMWRHTVLVAALCGRTLGAAQPLSPPCELTQPGGYLMHTLCNPNATRCCHTISIVGCMATTNTPPHQPIQCGKGNTARAGHLSGGGLRVVGWLHRMASGCTPPPTPQCVAHTISRRRPQRWRTNSSTIC